MSTSGKSSYEPLHLKYRPQRFADVVGQGAVVQTLANAIRLGRIAHAYLFCGPRGTGKTSSARILAKSLNCERGPTPDPCQVCSQCRSITDGSSLDVIEIDAASHTGVDNIRELIERAQFAPVNSRYKVYVIDECHMLSNAAFNALLKTLEEPPAHVVFVLATTDPQRVLPTVISRCQRFDYRRIPLEDMVAHLSKIAAQEGIPIAPEALQLVAQLSQGGLRDAERLLDQLSLLDGTITPEAVWDLVGGIPERQLLELSDALLAQDVRAVLSQTRQLLERGREPLVVLQNLVAFYRDLLLAKTAPQQRELVALTDPTWAALRQRAPRYSLEMLLAAQSHLRQCEVQIRQSGQPQLWLEIALLDLLGQLRREGGATGREALAADEPVGSSGAPAKPWAAAPTTPPSPVEESKKHLAAAPATAQTSPPTPAAPALSRKPAEPPKPASTRENPKDPVPPSPEIKLLRPCWEEFLKRLSPIAKALLGSGHLHHETPEEITLAFPSKGLVEKVRSKEAELYAVLHNLLQRPVRLNLVVQSAPFRIDGAAPVQDTPAPLRQKTLPGQDSPPVPPPGPAVPPSPPLPEPQVKASDGSAAALVAPGRSLRARDGKHDELAEIARRFADHFNGSLVDLEGVLGHPAAEGTEFTDESAADLSSGDALEAEGSPDLLPAESRGLLTRVEVRDTTPERPAASLPHPAAQPLEEGEPPF